MTTMNPGSGGVETPRDPAREMEVLYGWRWGTTLEGGFWLAGGRVSNVPEGIYASLTCCGCERVEYVVRCTRGDYRSLLTGCGFGQLLFTCLRKVHQALFCCRSYTTNTASPQPLVPSNVVCHATLVASVPGSVSFSVAFVSGSVSFFSLGIPSSPTTSPSSVALTLQHSRRSFSSSISSTAA